MKFLKDVSLVRKFLAGLGIIVAVSVVASITLLRSFSALEKQAQEVVRISRAVENSLRLRTALLEEDSILRHYADTADPSLLEELNASGARAEGYMKILADSNLSEASRKNLAALASVAGEHMGLTNRIVGSLNSGAPFGEIIRLFIERDRLDREERALLSSVTEAATADFERAIAQDIRFRVRTETNVLILAVSTVSFLIVVSLLITRGISNSLGALTAAAQEIANGKLDTEIDEQILSGKDEVGRLATAFREMTSKLKGTLDDLAASKKKIEEEKVRDEAILVSIGDGLVVTDRAGKILFINNGFEDLLGWRAMEVLGKYIFDVIPSEDEKGNRVATGARALSLALSTGKKIFPDVPATHYYLRRDRSRFPVSVTATPIILGSSIIGAVEVFRDMTLEREIDRAKSEFVSLASHQLRTPLSTVNWYAEMLLAGDVGAISRAQKKYLEEVYHANQRMVELVNALLNVSRIELGTFAVEPEPLDIVKIAKTALGEFKPQIRARKLKIEEKYDPKLPIIPADPRLAKIIFQNILSNAVKYTPAKGSVSLSVERRDPDVLITVSDTGYGIPEVAKKKIFTKMFRADNVQEKESDGTGLGLYIVKAIVEAAGGAIRFDSAENKGTTFFVTIPLSGMKAKTGSRGLTEERFTGTSTREGGAQAAARSKRP